MEGITMSPILDLQKRARELGRIRLGHVKQFTRKDGSSGTMPAKLDRFRLTSASRPLLEKVAELYGGEVAEWQPQGGGTTAWEVVTTSTRLPIMVPPQPVSQWYEYWTGGGIKHRCDGRTNVLTDELCDPEDYAHTEALRRPTTRLNVVLRDVEGIGVWRLETHGWNAAMELPDAAEFLAKAGGYVNGWVSLEERTSKAEVPDRQNGGTKIETRHFMVPIIEIDVTPADLMAGKGRIAPPALDAPAGRQAIEPPKPGPVEAAPQAAVESPWFGRLRASKTMEEAQSVWIAAVAAGFIGAQATPNEENRRWIEEAKALGKRLPSAANQQPVPADGEVVDAEMVPAPVSTGDEVIDGQLADAADADRVWGLCLAAADRVGLKELPRVVDDFVKRMGFHPSEAAAAELQAYLELLQGDPEPVAS